MNIRKIAKLGLKFYQNKMDLDPWLRGLKCHSLQKEICEVIFDFRIIF